MFVHLRLKEGAFSFDVNDPVPDKDPVYGIPNFGLHTLFSAARDDKTFINTGCKYDVVTDGNYQLRRKLTKDEVKFTKGMMGRPPTKVVKRKANQSCHSR